jgi:hypothetical protein
MLVDGGGDSRRGLIAAIERFIDAWNDPCTPFTWIKDPDKVICQGHQPTTGQDTDRCPIRTTSWPP